jgi:hypothetical protein
MQIGRIDTHHYYTNENNKTGSNGTKTPADANDADFIIELGSEREPRMRLYTSGLLTHIDKETIDLNTHEAGRSIDDAIVHAYYPVSEINDRLTAVLDGKDKSLSDATRAIIANLHIDNATTSPLEREELRALAEKQAQFIADNYLCGDDAKAYLDVINDIKSYADFSRNGMTLIGYTSLDQGGAAVYKPAGAPEGYVPASVALKMNDEDAYEKFTNAVKNGSGNLEVILRNLNAYQQSAYKTLKENLGMVKGSESLTALRELDTSSMESFSQLAVPTDSDMLQEGMTRFLSCFE